ncbi:MAG: hypothetical protein U9Q15_00295 [Patescibacteria group bacterium]|nr:hypothetical protein [Patescibacteria group bacterium]
MSILNIEKPITKKKRISSQNKIFSFSYKKYLPVFSMLTVLSLIIFSFIFWILSQRQESIIDQYEQANTIANEQNTTIEYIASDYQKEREDFISVFQKEHNKDILSLYDRLFIIESKEQNIRYIDSLSISDNILSVAYQLKEIENNFWSMIMRIGDYWLAGTLGESRFDSFYNDGSYLAEYSGVPIWKYIQRDTMDTEPVGIVQIYSGSVVLDSVEGLSVSTDRYNMEKGAINISWNAVDDTQIDFKRYVVFEGTSEDALEPVYTTTDLHYGKQIFIDHPEYFYMVLVEDQSGNFSYPSEIVRGLFEYDQILDPITNLTVNKQGSYWNLVWDPIQSKQLDNYIIYAGPEYSNLAQVAVTKDPSFQYYFPEDIPLLFQVKAQDTSGVLGK